MLRVEDVNEVTQVVYSATVTAASETVAGLDGDAESAAGGATLGPLLKGADGGPTAGIA